MIVPFIQITLNETILTNNVEQLIGVVLLCYQKVLSYQKVLVYQQVLLAI